MADDKQLDLFGEEEPDEKDQEDQEVQDDWPYPEVPIW